ncbi:MAG: SDR family NAD(P)-dependent oxidoreductase [Desulfurellaceae bacterium]|nr:SDR family NAD(P)-dependent oxidoreductase [Desulfurellaceae bacterium]
MQDLADRVAVITGAASGIGQGLARRLAREGMKLVLADIEEAALLEVEKELRLGGTPVLAVKTDVARKASVFALADRAFDAFGRVHIVCNNAGVSGGLGHIWDIPDQDWEWIMAVNVSGVLHGIQAFVPRMIEHGEEGLILNTSSVVGLTTGTSSVYGVTKHAVSRMTEGLHYDLRAAGSKLRAALLVPGATATNILYADRNRPQDLLVPRNEEAQAALIQRRQARHARLQEIGMTPEQLADLTVEGIRQERLYIIADPERTAQAVRLRMEGIVE